MFSKVKVNIFFIIEKLLTRIVSDDNIVFKKLFYDNIIFN